MRHPDSKPGPKRTQREREFDLPAISKMYLRGWSQRAIAEALSAERPYRLSHKTIGRDIKVLLAEWRESRLADIDEAKTAELARINELEREYWDSWERSKREGVRSTTEKRTGGGGGEATRAQIVKEDQYGDPRFLSGVERCVKMRCDILGLNAPVQSEVTGAGGGPIAIDGPFNLAALSTGELEALEQIVAKATGPQED